MSVVIPPNFAQVSIQMRNSADPQPWYVTYGIDVTPYAGDLVQAASDQFLLWIDYWGSRLSTTTNTENARLLVGQDGGEPVIVTSGVPTAGTSAAAKLPQNCALLIGKYTNLGGRKNRGRMFVPNVLREGDVSDTGVISNAFYNELINTCHGWFNALNEGTGATPTTPTSMVILHNDYGIDTPPPTEVIAFEPHPTIATQRRRLRH